MVLDRHRDPQAEPDRAIADAGVEREEHEHRPMLRAITRIECYRRTMLRLAFRAGEFLFYKGLLGVVDRVSRLPRDTDLPDAMRLYRENIALKAQLDALQAAHASSKPKRMPVRTRAAQVFAYYLTRGNHSFQDYSLSAPLTTIYRWIGVFRGRQRRGGGRPRTHREIEELVLTLKSENPGWGQRRIREELRRMGIRLSEPTVQRILAEHGFGPSPRGGKHVEPLRAAVKDAVWAIDYFAVRTASIGGRPARHASNRVLKHASMQPMDS